MYMAEVSIRDLRNHGGEVVDRVTRGERLTVTWAGKAVAELSPLRRPALSAETLQARWKRLPLVDPARLRHDIDVVVDAAL